jgi:PAS domain S-box-containing protein
MQVDRNAVSRLLGELGKLDCSLGELAEIFTVLVEDWPVPLWIFNSDNYIVYNNRASCRFGTGENAIGEHVESYSPQMREMLMDGLTAAREARAGCYREKWITSHIIGTRFLHLDFLPLPGGMIACLVQDYTESKQVEEALQASEERSAFYADMLERALVPFGAAYPDGRVMTANLAFCELTGYMEEELHALSMFFDLTARGSRDTETEALLRLKHSRQPQRYEKEIPCKGGGGVWVEVFIQIVATHQGEMRHYIFFLTDITARRQAMEALRRSEERLALALEGAADGVWDYDPVTGRIHRSPFIAAQLGYDAESTLPSPEDWLQLVHPEDQPAVRAAWEEHLAGRTKRYTTEYRMRTADGGYLWMLDSGKIVQRDEQGQPLRITGTLKNITDRKKAEEERQALEEQISQSQKLEAIGTLAGGIAHDFNNLLFAILGYADLVRSELTPNSLEYANIQALISAANRAKGLVRQILTFSRKNRSVPVMLDVNHSIKDAMKLMRAALPSTIEIRQRLAAVPPFVLADPTELHQVVMNIATNAAQAIGESPGVVEVVSHEAEVRSGSAVFGAQIEPGRYCVIEISDTGSGIPLEVRDRIFEPFYTTKERGKGTGLGLSMVHGIVSRLGGAIAVDSEPGAGSRFLVYLPAQQRPNQPSALPEHSIPRGQGHLLVVDDEPDVRNVLRQTLKSLGYEATSAATALEALEYIRKDPKRFAAVITDQTMPMMTGTELARTLRNLAPDLPVMICTGYSESLTPDILSELKISALLDKPIRRAVLANAVHKAINPTGLP